MNNVELHFLKIIWGDVTILKCKDEVGLIDTGYNTNFEQIRDYLNSLGVSEISFILLTHFHRDHYGSIPQLLDAFKVKRVYFKEYSGLESKTAWGTLADDEYRNAEIEKCESMKELIRAKSSLIPAEGVKSLDFAGYKIDLYSTENRVREIFYDESRENTYRRYVHGENLNSLVANLKVGSANLFFGGDVFDRPSEDPRSDRINTAIAKALGEEVAVYKVPHHGTGGCNSDEALAIYKPKIAVITNRIGYLTEKSPIFADLKRANPDVRILLTEMTDVIIEVTPVGEVRIRQCDDLEI